MYVGRLLSRTCEQSCVALSHSTDVAGSPLRVDALHISDHQHPQVDARRDRWPATGLVVRLTQLLHEQIKPVFREQTTEIVVKDMSGPRANRSVGVQNSR
jgi:hypothetical protein